MSPKQTQPLACCSVVPHGVLRAIVSLAIGLNQVLRHLVLETVVEHFDIHSRVILLGSVLVRSREHRDVVGGVDGHITCQPVLIVQLVEGDGRSGGIRVAHLVSCVGDQRGNVLLQLGQVHRDVRLSELCVLVVALRLGNLGREVSVLEV